MNTSSFYNLALIVMLSSGVLNSVLGFLALQKGRNKLSNRWFFVVAQLSALIGIMNYLLRITGEVKLLSPIWGIGILMTFIAIVWLKIFVKGNKVKLREKMIFIFLGLISLTITQFNGFLDNIKRVSLIVFKGDSGPLFFVMLAFQMFGFVYVVAQCTSYYKNSSSLLKNQLRYVLIGILGYGFVAITAGIIFTSIGYPELAFLDSFASLIWVGFTFYAIVKHKLMDIRLVILRTITYSLVVVVISAFVVGIAIFIPRQIQNTTSQTLIAIAVSILLVVILDPLKKYIGKATDKLFFKATINYAELLRNLSETINREIDLNKLVESVENRLTSQLKIQYAKIALPTPSNLEFAPLIQSTAKNIRITKSSNLVKYVEQAKRVVVLEALERRIEDTQDETQRKELEKSKAQLDDMSASIVAPIITTDKKLSGLLVLGIKKSGDPYNQDDLNLLELLGPQLASAIEKSRLYEEIRSFNIKLQKEISIATENLRRTNEEVQDRNRFLSSLQTVTNLITRSLDFKKVTQSIVDSIATQMGFIGGILLFYGESHHKLFPEAITRVQYKDEVEKLLEGKLSQFHADVRKDTTLAVKTVLEGKITKGSKLTEFVSPPVPEPICWAIQKLVKAQGFIGVPIVSEDEIVGCIIFITHETPEELNKNDMNMMTALADQTGIVYRNLELVQRLRSTNDELAEANEHLKQLDQAKSEFVSIASHQLRTPMTGIMGYLSMFVGGDFGKIPTQQMQVLRQLLDASQKMIGLINLFLDVTKIESGRLVLDRRPHHIEDIIQRSYDVLSKLAANKGLKIIWKKPKQPLPILTIDEKIFDVVSNLIDNAIKYSQKGAITVTAEVVEGNVKVTVTDTGIGIPPQTAKNLFNKFVRGYGIAQVNPDGSGLGLYVARRLTEAHGGKIWVESKGAGKGSSFMFTLPITPSPVAEDAT